MQNQRRYFDLILRSFGSLKLFERVFNFSDMFFGGYGNDWLVALINCRTENYEPTTTYVPTYFAT